MVLQRVQFLLQTVVDLGQLLVVAVDSVQLAAEAQDLATVVGQLLICVFLGNGEVLIPGSLYLLLAQELALGFKQEVVPLACAITVLLQT